jgi:predicted nucleotidyltransferase
MRGIGYTGAVDFRRPVEAVIPGAQGRILAVLTETTAELNLRTIARLAHVSPAQASRVLPDLVALGLVERREAPPSALFAMVDEHVASRAVRALSRSRQAVLEELGELAAGIDPAPAATIVFGSFARGEADRDSDLDMILVRPARVGEEDERWAESVDRFRTAAGRLTGNPLEVLEVSHSEISQRLRSGAPLWTDVRREAVSVQGARIENLSRAKR